jgi:hypothetical protein
MDTLIVIGCIKFQLTPKIFYTLLTKVYTSETLTTSKIFFGYIDSNRLSRISTDF